MLLTDLVEDYTNMLRGEGHRPRGIEHYIYVLHRFLRWLGDEADEHTLTTHTIRRYQAELGARQLHPGTIGNALTVIRSFCRFLIDEELLTTDLRSGLNDPRNRKTHRVHSPAINW